MFLDACVETYVRLANIGRRRTREREFLHNRIIVRFWNRIFSRCKSANINSLPEGDELDRFLYESRDLTCVISYETTTFLSNKRQFNPNCWYAFTFMGCGFVGFTISEGFDLLCD